MWTPADVWRRGLGHLRGDVVVVGLPRGGVPVAAEVARALDAPLDVIVVRKLGVPFQPELGMGAIGEDGVRVINAEVVRLARVTGDELAAVEARERAELARRASRFRAGRSSRSRWPGGWWWSSTTASPPGRRPGPRARWPAPRAPRGSCSRCRSPRRTGPIGSPAPPTRSSASTTPEPFFGVGQFYVDFTQTTDDEVIACLTGGRPRRTAAASRGTIRRSATRRSRCRPARCSWTGTSPCPRGAGVVVFAHGSGSSRHSPRNRYVASVLNAAGLATLLFDLLTPREELDRANVFDIELLGRRLGDVTRWLRTEPETAGLPVGYFGASTGAAAALCGRPPSRAPPSPRSCPAAAAPTSPDPASADVTAPTLLIVGGRDDVVLDLNRQAQARAALREPAGRGARRHPPVRGARHPADGRRAGQGLVPVLVRPRLRPPSLIADSPRAVTKWSRPQ